MLDGPTFTTYDLRLFNHDGTPKPFNAPILTGVPAGMAAAISTTTVSLRRFLSTTAIRLEPRQRFTFSSPMVQNGPAGRWNFGIAQQFFQLSGVAVGDLRRDGHEEIVVSNGSGLYIFNPDGTPFSSGWPLPMRTLPPTYGH